MNIYRNLKILKSKKILNKLPFNINFYNERINNNFKKYLKDDKNTKKSKKKEQILLFK